MDESKTIVVLGGGVGGVVAARRLRASFPPGDRVVLIDRRPEQSFPPSYTWVMTGERGPAAITRDLRSLRRKGIDVVEGNVETIDVSERRGHRRRQLVALANEALAGERCGVPLGRDGVVCGPVPRANVERARDPDACAIVSLVSPEPGVRASRILDGGVEEPPVIERA
jgi:NADPH-dependent 2,4-dienoyl-CoA reductase/sulfur reductase-like enzyme